MKTSNLYTTHREIVLRKELKKKYDVEEHKLTGQTSSRLYPARLDKREKISLKRTA